MKLLIKELCKKKGTTLSEVANKAGIARETISRQVIDGNPTLSTLIGIANALDVDISELFPGTKVTGAIRIGDETHVIDSVSDIERLLKEIKSNQYVDS